MTFCNRLSILKTYLKNWQVAKVARQRVEDLGRIAVLLRHVLDLGVFDIPNGRPKHYPDRFNGLPEEAKDEELLTIAYGIDNIQTHLHEILAIAEGNDDLNVGDDGI